MELVSIMSAPSASALLFDCLFAFTEKGSACFWSLDLGGLSSMGGTVHQSVCQGEGVHPGHWWSICHVESTRMGLVTGSYLHGWPPAENR